MKIWPNYRSSVLREDEVFVDLTNADHPEGNASDSDDSLLGMFGLGDHAPPQQRNASQRTNTSTTAQNNSTANASQRTDTSTTAQNKQSDNKTLLASKHMPRIVTSKLIWDSQMMKQLPELIGWQSKPSITIVSVYFTKSAKAFRMEAMASSDEYRQILSKK